VTKSSSNKRLRKSCIRKDRSMGRCCLRLECTSFLITRLLISYSKRVNLTLNRVLKEYKRTCEKTGKFYEAKKARYKVDLLKSKE
jgi:hypothetical protein